MAFNECHIASVCHHHIKYFISLRSDRQPANAKSESEEKCKRKRAVEIGDRGSEEIWCYDLFGGFCAVILFVKSVHLLDLGWTTELGVYLLFHLFPLLFTDIPSYMCGCDVTVICGKS